MLLLTSRRLPRPRRGGLAKRDAVISPSVRALQIDGRQVVGQRPPLSCRTSPPRGGRWAASARRSLPPWLKRDSLSGTTPAVRPLDAKHRHTEPTTRSPRMTPTITAFERSPDGGKGLARDTRVRWALEEVGQPYEVRLVSFRAMKEPAHLALHPFGQIPTYEEGDLGLFETGAIVFHIAERHAGLLPGDANARARAITWMFAALSTVEPPILELGTARLLEGDKLWSAQRMPLVEDR